MEEIKDGKPAKFVTLTFSPESLHKLTEIVTEAAPVKGYELDNAIATKATRLFLERWRKKYKKSVKHWLVTELGQDETEHLHIHGIIWTEQSLEEIERIWQYGITAKQKNNFVNEKTVNYIIKYVNKTDSKHKMYKPIILCSKGIGSNYTKQKHGDWQKNKFKEDTETNETYRTRTGHTVWTFPLANIDNMRKALLAHQSETTPYKVTMNSAIPYGNCVNHFVTTINQQGLALKTYQSDLFNNWLSTEWIDGTDGISAVTAISTVGDSFTLDTLNLSKKVYDMLNRIAVSGGR